MIDHVSGNEVLFAVVPDILARLPLHQVIGTLYLLVIAVWGILSAVLVMTAFVDTLIDTFPKLIPYRLCTCSIMCIATLMVNISMLHNNYHLFFLNWSQNGMIITLLVLLIIFIIALFVYTLTNIANDYHFIYGSPLKFYWILSTKGTFFIVLTCFTLMSFEKFEFIETKTDFYLLTIMYFLLVLILMPIPIYMVYIYIQYQTSKKKIFMINSAPNWGPSKIVHRHARKRFNPEREMHYKAEITHCKHNCLLNSTRIKDEIERLNENRQMLVDAVDEETLLQET